jgi:hypothetical protein
MGSGKVEIGRRDEMGASRSIGNPRSARHGGLTLVAICAALAVAACGGSGATPSASGATPTDTSTSSAAATATATPTATATATATATPTASPTPSPTAVPVAPIVTSVTISSSASDSRWTVSFKKPVVSGIPAAVATAMNNAITTKVNGFITDFTGSGLPPVASGDVPSTFEGNFTVALASPSLLSLRFTVVEYVTGAAHPFELVSSLNFRVPTGAAIHLADLFTGSAAALPVLRTQAHNLLLADLGVDLTWPPTPPMSFFETCWVFTTAGLEFTWNQGDLAAMAAGSPSVAIPWASLHAVILASGPAGEFL